MALVPSAAVLEAWTTIADARAWIGVTDPEWAEVARSLGDESLDTLLILAATPDADFIAARDATTVPVVRRVVLNLMFNAIKQKFGMDTNILTGVPAAPAASTPASTTTTTTEVQRSVLPPAKVRLSSIINQASDQEIPLLPERELAALRHRYHLLCGDAPLDGAEVTDNQLTALKYMLDSNLNIYVDFGVWGPYGQRNERRMKFLNHFMDASGRWQTAEQPGPSCLEAWRDCWGVFTSAALMLQLASVATLQRYAARFEERCKRYPRSWHICVIAEDRCRSEFFPGEKRRQERFHADHPSMSGFDPMKPWNSVFREATDNTDYWLRELQEPAWLYSERRGAVAPSWTHQQQDAAAYSPSNSPYQHQPQQHQGDKRDRPWEQQGDRARKGKNGKYTHGRTGLEICYTYNRSEGGCSTQRWCPNGREHACEYCLSNHRGCQQICRASRATGNEAGDKGGRGKGGKSKGRKWK